MDLANLFMRAIDNRGDVYLPFSFGDGFTDAERMAVASVVSQYVPQSVDAMFNNWRFCKYGPRAFYAMRATWDMGGISADSAQELAEKIREYYERH